MFFRQHRSAVLLLIAAALALTAIAALYLSAPPPTVLTVQIMEAGTERPIAGAQVSARPGGGRPLPRATTDDLGQVRFEEPTPSASYEVRVQRTDYALATAHEMVAEGQHTELVLYLSPQAGGRLFVGLDRPEVVEIDTASLLTERIFKLPAPEAAPVRFLRLSPDRDVLYVIVGGQGLALDSRTGVLRTELELRGTVEGLEISQDGGHLLVAGVIPRDASGQLDLAHVWTLDAKSGRVLSDTLPVDAGPMGGIAWQSDGIDSLILSTVSRGARRWHPRAAYWGMGAGSYPTGASLPSRRAVVSPGGEYFYTWFSGRSPVDGEVDILALVDTQTGEWVDEHTPRGVSAMAMAPAGQALYVLNGRMGTLTIVDLVGSQPRRLLPAGKRPEVLTIDPDGARAYIGDRGAPAVLVVDLAQAQMVHTLPLEGEPLSLAVR